jgi:hypothetical protein
MAKRTLLVCLGVTVLLALTAGVALAVNKQCMTTNNNHTCFGTLRADTLLGTEKFESIYGRSGPDTIKSFAGGDTVYGENGNDDLFAGEGEDRVFPGSGNDTSRGGKGSDKYEFYGGWGKDIIIDTRPARQGCPRCPFNIVEFPGAPSTPIIVNLDSSPNRSEVRDASGAHSINWSDDVVTGVGNTGRGDDIIRGNERGNEIGSNNGDDTVYGMADDDFVIVADNAGGDTVDCGIGNDTVYFDPGDTVLNCEVRRDLQGNLQ